MVLMKERLFVCLDIEDIYSRHDPELVEILENRLKAEIAFDLKFRT
jgi:predicted protein tyrosine phosphatase